MPSTGWNIIGLNSAVHQLEGCASLEDAPVAPMHLSAVACRLGRLRLNRRLCCIYAVAGLRMKYVLRVPTDESVRFSVPFCLACSGSVCSHFRLCVSQLDASAEHNIALLWQNAG